MSHHDIEMVSTDMLIPLNHIYREIKPIFDLKKIHKFLINDKSNVASHGFGNDRMILINILQFLKNLSDRDTEKELQENIPSKWFCNFSISEKTPTYSSLCKFRSDVIYREKLFFFYEEIKDQFENSNLTNSIKKKFRLGKNLKIFKDKNSQLC